MSYEMLGHLVSFAHSNFSLRYKNIYKPVQEQDHLIYPLLQI